MKINSSETPRPVFNDVGFGETFCYRAALNSRVDIVNAEVNVNG